MKPNPIHTIVFAPIAIREGMAGAKRLGNLAEYLKNDYRVINLYHAKGRQKNEVDGIQFQSYRSSVTEILALVQIKRVYGKGQLFYFYYGYPSLKNICNLLVTWLLGFHIYLDIVEDYKAVARYKPGLLRKLKLYISVWLLKYSSPFVRGYIVISENLRGMLETMFSRRKKILLLPISIDRHRFDSLRVTEPAQVSFFYGGSFAPKDDFGVLLQSFVNVYEKYPGSVGRLFLSGKCPESKRRQILEMAGAARSRAIEFLGYLNDEHYYRFIQDAHVLVMPRNNSDFANTGFPFKLGEYMATGNCVVSAKLPSVVEMIGDDALVYYTPESVESLTSAFSFAVNEPAACRQFGDRARDIAFEKFDAQKHVRKLTDFLMNS